MRIKVDGRELLVKKTTLGMVDMQRQTGWKLEDIEEKAKEGYGLAMLAFWALHNAGFSPVWDDIVLRDIEEFEVIQEPGDTRGGPEVDAADPQISRADSDPGGEWPPATE